MNERVCNIELTGKVLSRETPFVNESGSFTVQKFLVECERAGYNGEPITEVYPLEAVNVTQKLFSQISDGETIKCTVDIRPWSFVSQKTGDTQYRVELRAYRIDRISSGGNESYRPSEPSSKQDILQTADSNSKPVNSELSSEDELPF